MTATAGKPVVTAEQIRQASFSCVVGNGEFQPREWSTPNPQANNPNNVAGTFWKYGFAT